jgi:hypothetical protein
MSVRHGSPPRASPFTLREPDGTSLLHAMMGIGEEQILALLRHRRGVIAAAALVAFNVVMFVLAAAGSNSIEAPFLVAWITGDAVLTLAALAITERS